MKKLIKFFGQIFSKKIIKKSEDDWSDFTISKIYSYDYMLDQELKNKNSKMYHCSNGFDPKPKNKDLENFIISCRDTIDVIISKDKRIQELEDTLKSKEFELNQQGLRYLDLFKSMQELEAQYKSKIVK